MKHFTALSNVPTRINLIVLILSAVFLATATSADLQQQSRVAFKQRAMDAAQQMKELRQALQVSKQHPRGISAEREEVGIRINSKTQTSSTIFFYDNMESGTNGWTTLAYTGSDLWHQTSNNWLSSSHSWWPGLDGQSNYDNGSRINGAVISPTINLTAAVAPISLLFGENYATERGWDYCMVDVSTDAGANWTHLRGGYGSAPAGSSDGWIISTLDLSAYAGQNIQIRFYFDTGDQNFNEFPGWFVDDVVIFDQGGQITGKKFFDVNNNGIKDVGERGVKNWLITAEGPISLTTKTNYRGRYWLTLPLGSYTVSETFQPNWTQTYPLSGTWSLTLSTPDTLIDSVHFGNYINASFINGRKFHDLDKDGAFNNADTLIPEWKILLCDTNGVQLDFDRTDSLGEYSLYIFEPGTYVVKEVERNGWVQSAPVTETYKITIPDLNTDSNGNDFGNYYSPLTNSILGMKFNDRDRSHSFTAGEEGVEGFKIQLYKKGNGNNYNLYKTRTTDSSGMYQFSSLPADTYRVKEIPRQGWWQSYPDSSWSLTLNDGETLDSVDFGNYEIVTGSVSGLKYNDLNDNGSMDTNETGLQGWNILLTGSTYFNASVSQSLYTDGNGNYSFSGIWPGSYVVSEVWHSGWRQTEPANLGPHFVNLDVEENRTGVNFGNVQDSTFSVSFRTFKPESLAFALDLKGKHKPVLTKAINTQFWETIRNTYPDSAISARIKFKYAYQPGTLVVRPGVTITPVSDKNKVIDLTFSPALQPNDTVTVSGFTKKAVVWVDPVYTLNFNDSSKSGNWWSHTAYMRSAMPNAVNLLEKVGVGLKVGLGGPHSVVHLGWKNVISSLFIKPDRIHIGDPRCLDFYAGTTKSIKKQQKYLTPTKGNNKLFSELIALQANIRGSDLLVLPGGFGNLVFDDTTGGGTQINGLTIREIAAKADSFMSSYKDTVPAIPCNMPEGLATYTVNQLYEKIRMIDSVFSGPVDTVSFSGSGGLKFTPVAPLSSVPFLRFDPLAAQRAGFISLPPQTGYAVPDVFALNQNYPNPFNPTTTISFTLSQPSLVTVRVYNILGQEVATLVSRQEMEDGDQEVEFNANNLPSGVYFCRLVAEGIPDDDEGITATTFTAIKKMLLVK
ncbi:MAG TPA: SdrD B-like domain-containing protein [Bacteroidota bacterium]|jgi:hypothetical protein|nr:SdrD B-like domain-containing protein [Bacteroidota bacterium]